MAVKTCKVGQAGGDEEGSIAEFLTEARVMRHFKHDVNIVRSIGVFKKNFENIRRFYFI